MREKWELGYGCVRWRHGGERGRVEMDRMWRWWGEVIEVRGGVEL